MIFNNQKLIYKGNPSKSYLHRYLILTSFIDDTFYIENFSLNNDIKETINVLIALGKDISIEDDKIIVKGCHECKKVDEVFINESGSTLRLLLPILSYFNVKRIKLGDRLKSRPIQLYLPFIEDKKDNIIYLKKGQLNEIDGSISSQFISGLLIYNAIINNKNKLNIKNKIVSKNYIEITFDVLRNLGFIFENYSLIKKVDHIKKIIIEDDYSSAANYLIYGLLNQGITLNNLNENSLQGDKQIFDLFKDYVSYNNNEIMIHKCLKEPINIDLENMIDLGPIMFVYACFANGRSIFTNINRLKDKESDRLNAMLDTFNLLGVDYLLEDNKLTINGKSVYRLINAKTYNDHRIAMALIVFGLTNKNGINLDSIECIKKSNLNFLIN